MHDLKTRGIEALVWDFLGKFSTNAVTFVVTLVLARLLDPADFGLIALIMVIAVVGEAFIDGGLGVALIQRRHVHDAHYSMAFLFNVFVGSLLAGLVYVFSESIAGFYAQPQLAELLDVAALLFLLNSFNTTQRVLLRKHLHNKRLSKINIAAAVVGGVAGIVGALLGLGVWALLLQLLATSFLSALMLWVQSDWEPRWIWSWKALRGLWGFGFRMFLVSLLDKVYTRVDYAIVGKLFPIDVLGFFQRAKSLNLMAVDYASGSLVSVLFPVLSTIQRDAPRFQAVVVKGFNVVLFGSFMLFGTLYVGAEPLMVVLFSEKWRPAAEYFAILALSGALYPLNAVLVNVLSARGDSKRFLHMALWKKAVGIANIVIGFSIGLQAYLYGLIVAGAISTGISIHYAARECGLDAWHFARRALIQAVCALVALIPATMFATAVDGGDTVSLFLGAGTFLLLYWAVSAILATDAYLATVAEVGPLLRKFFKRGG